MLPPLDQVKSDLLRTTETLAGELARAGRGTDVPAWSDTEWRVAAAAAVAHGVSPLLAGCSLWPSREWQDFLASQREHVELRQRRIADLLTRIDARSRDLGVPMMALKGSALHGLGIYVAGERPMADIDLLVGPEHADAAAAVLAELGYEETYRQWKHVVFKPTGARPASAFGEHRDTPINIELHTRIHERLPIRTVDVTSTVWARDAAPGINPYPSMGALMTHLLLHAAGSICGRSLRLLHLHDMAQLSRRMRRAEWEPLWQGADAPWWAYPPLRLVDRYFPGNVPRAVLQRLRRDTTPLLRALSSRQTLTSVSCSHLWLHLLPGVEWVRTPGDLATLLLRRVKPSHESREERVDMLRTQAWLQGQEWVRQGHVRRVVTALTRPVPRMDTLYVVRGALAREGQGIAS